MMVLGLIAKWGSIAGGIVIFILFAVRASQVGLGNAGSEVGSGISNIGKGIGETGGGIAQFGQGIGAGITGLFSPLLFFKNLIYGADSSGTKTNPTAAAANNNSVTTATQANPVYTTLSSRVGSAIGSVGFSPSGATLTRTINGLRINTKTANLSGLSPSGRAKVQASRNRAAGKKR